ncbi:MAG: LptF/LptG family permease, partial [bacterium]|nr:LptF/LptG family permease [bacterium]
ELVGVNLAWMLALSVPMSVLVATLMAFGRLSSDFEITAIKASGINLVRVMLPVLAAGMVVTFGMVQFNDKVLPDLNKKARELWSSIRAVRPTLVFRSGIFVSDIPGYLVLVEKVDHRSSRVEGVTITDTRNPAKPRIVVAQYGFLEMTDQGRNMQFALFNGEIYSLDMADPENYREVDFDSQIINVSASSSELNRTSSDIRTDREMNIKSMRDTVEELAESITPSRIRIQANLQKNFNSLFNDSLLGGLRDSVSYPVMLNSVKREARLLSQYVNRNQNSIKHLKNQINKYEIEIYKKYSIPAASLAFILIGAPLAMMARRGGMGYSIAVSIGLFVVYWAFLIGGEDLSDRGILNPFLSMWAANFLVGGIGLYLAFVVTSERTIFGFFRRKGKS